MDIDVVDWDFRGIIPKGMDNISAVVEHRGPHHKFIEECMRKFKRENWNSWITVTDTDE